MRRDHNVCPQAHLFGRGKAGFILLLAVLLFPVLTEARHGHGNTWIFGEDIGLRFHQGEPSVLSEPILFTAQGSAAISDEEGHLLFYTDGVDVWNARYERMPHGNGLMGSALSSQPAMIVPRPGTQHLYYIFTVSEQLGVYYSIVDLTRENGDGDVTQKNLRLRNSSAGKITAVSHQNARDIWVIAPGRNDNAFQAYLVTAAGVNPEPVISHAGIAHTRSPFDCSGVLKASPDGTKLALSVFDPGFFELFDFDPASGVVSHPVMLGDYEAAYGVEFSSDSNKLYATVVSWVDKSVYQFDLDAPAIRHSVQNAGKSSADMRFQALQLGPDGRIYLIRENTAYLGVINFPNQPGTACHYIDEGLELKGRKAQLGLPNFIQSFFVPPVIALTVHDAAAGEDDQSVIFPVRLSEKSRVPISIDYNTRNLSAASGQDYMAATGTLRIPAGALSGDIAVPLIDDTRVDEGDETFLLIISNPVHAVLKTPQARGTIRENDLVRISIGAAAAPEGSSRLHFPVQLSAPSQFDVLVTYSTEDGTAAAERDYIATSGTLTIPAGESSGNISVPLIDDALDEPDTSCLMRLSHPINATLDHGQAVGTIADDDPPPGVVIADVTEYEKTGAMRFPVELSSASGFDVTFEYSTRNDSATASQDYAATSGTLFLPAGSLSGTILVDIVDDEVDEQDETFILDLRNPTGVTLTDAHIRGIILDNDKLPTLAIEREISAAENSGMLRVPVRLSAVSGRDISVKYSTSDGRALAGHDYTKQSGTLTIPAGEAAATISVPLLDDPLEEQDETFSIYLLDATYAEISHDLATGTIRDNDPPPVVSVDSATAAEDAGELTFAVTLSHPSYQDVSVNYATIDGTATLTDDDYRVIPDTVMTIPSGKTGGAIRVRITDDLTVEGDETLYVQLHHPVNATPGNARGTGTIIDNEALPEVIIEDVSANEETGLAAFTIRLSESSTLPVIFHYTTHDGTARAYQDYIPVDGIMALAPESLTGTVQVRLIPNREREEEKTFGLELRTLHNAQFKKSRGLATLLQRKDQTPQ